MQDIWAIFLLWVLCSKYSKLKLGKDDEEPEHSNAAWFAMLFSCGVAVGLYYFGVGAYIASTTLVVALT